MKSKYLSDTWGGVALLWLIIIVSAIPTFWLWEEVGTWWAKALAFPLLMIFCWGGFSANIALTYKVGEFIDSRWETNMCNESKMETVKLTLGVIWYSLLLGAIYKIQSFF